MALGCAALVDASESVTYIHTDAGGSPIAATDASGNVVWRESYRPYGERTRNEPASAGNRQFFHGKALDPESGLSYFGARYYDPAIGRFMGADPAGFDENNLHSSNRYAYGNNNPYKYKDPDGRSPLLIFLAPVVVQATGAVIAGGINATQQYANTGTVRWNGLGGVFDAMGDGALEALALGGGLSAARTGAVAGANATKGGIAFGQATVKSTFAHGPHAGKTIGEVAAGLRSGAVSADSLPIEYVIRHGQPVALNNRSLLALQRAGMEPTVTRNLTGNPAAEALLDGHLRGGVASDVIRVRGGSSGTSVIE